MNNRFPAQFVIAQITGKQRIKGLMFLLFPRPGGVGGGQQENRQQVEQHKDGKKVTKKSLTISGPTRQSSDGINHKQKEKHNQRKASRDQKTLSRTFGGSKVKMGRPVGTSQLGPERACLAWAGSSGVRPPW